MGLSTELFTPLQPISEEFLCPICHDVLEGVVMLDPCEHTLCFECHAEWKAQAPAVEGVCSRHGNVIEKCPVDRQIVVGLKKPQRPFINLLNGLRMYCPFKADGCSVVVTVETVKTHCGQCEFNPTVPKLCTVPGGCGLEFVGTATEKASHNCVAHLLAVVKEKDEKIRVQEIEIRKLTLLVGSVIHINPTTGRPDPGSPFMLISKPRPTSASATASAAGPLATTTRTRNETSLACIVRRKKPTTETEPMEDD